MKSMKITLGAVYVILIILLLLMNLKRCTHEPQRRSAPTPADTVRNDRQERDSIIERAEEAGQMGALKVTLLWDFDGDIDLHVKQPNGKVIWYQDTKDYSTGGYLDRDNEIGGRGSAENVFWENPPKGQYQVRLVYYGGEHPMGYRGSKSGKCTVVVFQQGVESKTYTVNMTHENQKEDITTITVN